MAWWIMAVTLLSSPSSFSPSLAGHWESAPLELALTDEFHRSVYGDGARSVRSVAMTIQPSGDGVFRVTTSVRNRRGYVPGTQETQEVVFTLGTLVEEAGRPPHYATRVEKAERRFADDPSSAFARDGVTLAIYPPESKPGTLEVRFDTPEGTGSFWETLSKRARPGRSSQPRSMTPVQRGTRD